MTPVDFDEVARVDLAAFAWAARQGGLAPVETERHRRGLAYFVGKGPGLCLVAEGPPGCSQQVLGYAFGHRWGSTAWVGPLGVDIPFMGRGIGTALLDELCRRSREAGATTIGLETSLAGNVRFYGRKGFLPGAVRLLAAKDLPSGGEESGSGAQAVARGPGSGVRGAARRAGIQRGAPLVREWSSIGLAARRDLAGEARRLAGKASPGLDHTAEFDAVVSAGAGETLVASWPGGGLAGYAVIHHYAVRASPAPGGLSPVEPAVWILVGCQEAVGPLLGEVETRAAAMGATRLRVPCYTGGVHGYLLLRALGYRPETGYARLFLGGPPPAAPEQSDPGGPAVLDFSAWLG
jgi:GNAT superfamily N-acetyltransferase